MKKLLLLTLVFSLKSFAQFKPGNLIISRVGDGTAPLTNIGTALFLDEYTPAGTFVKSWPLPTKAAGANKPLIVSGTALSEGIINRSVDSQYIVLTGYAQELGDSGRIAATTASNVNRVIGLVNYNGSINTTTALSDYSSGGSPRGAVSVNGTNLWMVAANGGVRYTTVGSTTSKPVSTAIDNLRNVNIFDNQLYTAIGTTTTARVGAVSTGTPTTSGQTITGLPGVATTGSPYQFQFFDLNPTIPGSDVLYIADEDSALFKYSFDPAANKWVTNGAIGTRFDYYRGVTGTAAGNTVTLYAIRKGGTIKNGSGGELVLINDASGHNGTLTATPVIIATAATYTGFRGVALAPRQTLISEIILPIKFSNVKATVINGAAIQVGFTNETESNMDYYSIERSVNGRDFSAVHTLSPFLNNDNRAYYNWLDNSPLPAVNYYRIKGVEKDGKTVYSIVVKASMSNRDNALTIFPNPVQGAQLAWEAILPKGEYNVQIISTAGQIIYHQVVAHSAGNLHQTIILPAAVKRGTYTIQVSNSTAKFHKIFMIL